MGAWPACSDVSHLGNSGRLLPWSRRVKIVLIRLWFLINRLVFVRIILRITPIFIFRACVKTGHLCEGLLKDFVTRPRLRGTWAHVTYLASEPAAFQGNTLPFRSCPSLGEPSWFTEVSSTAFSGKEPTSEQEFSSRSSASECFAILLQGEPRWKRNDHVTGCSHVVEISYRRDSVLFPFYFEFGYPLALSFVTHEIKFIPDRWRLVLRSWATTYKKPIGE